MKALNHWYVIGEDHTVDINKPFKVTIRDTPITVWKDHTRAYSAISDICSHRGVSLSKGRVDTSLNCVVCPYHTFKFNSCGRLVQTPGQASVRGNQSKFSKKTDVPYYHIIRKNNWIYMYDKPCQDLDVLPGGYDFWIEPEAYDRDFRAIDISKDFDIDARTVSENSLDILHISELHSFGNMLKPLPSDDKVERISDGHIKVTYKYEAGEKSIPRLLYGIKELTVENEYVIPHYTVARVKFGPYVNTVITSALPISDNKTRLFVKTYRNNLITGMPLLDKIFDDITRLLMEKTLCEDKSVVDTIYPEYKDGNFITKYDELIRTYREDYDIYVTRD
tara:strand:+ start:452 stop:1456 length:1005 start_codon:yes stop_codon:yes gene_type:complete